MNTYSYNIVSFIIYSHFLDLSLLVPLFATYSKYSKKGSILSKIMLVYEFLQDEYSVIMDDPSVCIKNIRFR
jgi:hypothetical protein